MRSPRAFTGRGTGARGPSWMRASALCWRATPTSCSAPISMRAPPAWCAGHPTEGSTAATPAQRARGRRCASLTTTGSPCTTSRAPSTRRGCSSSARRPFERRRWRRLRGSAERGESSMPTVQTVQGPVDAAELGVVLIHEHLRFRDEAVAAEWPDRYDEAAEFEAALEAAGAAKSRGVQTIVDPTAMFGGRDVRFMARVAEQIGVRVIACTGIYSYDYLPHYFENRDVDVMAEHFVADLQDGVQGSDIKAAFLTCAADAPGLTAHVEQIHRAVARASVQTGAPIMAHSMPAVETGPRQVEIFAQEGVDLARVQIAHCGDTDDVSYIEGLIDRGVYVGLDRYGLEMFLPIDKRNATAAELLRRGHAERMMISQDYCATIDWYPPEARPVFEGQGAIRNWSMTLVFDEVVPALREQGALDDQAFQTIFVGNPRRWLTA